MYSNNVLGLQEALYTVTLSSDRPILCLLFPVAFLNCLNLQVL